MITLDRHSAARCVAGPVWGRQREGMAPAGPVDRFAAAVANRLVGNADDAAVLEIPLSKGQLVTDQALHIAISGAAFGWTCNGERLPMNRSCEVPAASVLAWQGGEHGFRSYLAVQGGLRNTGQPWQLASEACTNAVARQRQPWVVLAQGLWQRQVIRVLPGPEANDTAMAYLCGQPWQLSRQSDAQGVRLLGEGAAPVLPSMASAPVLDGTVQLTPAGPIVLMRERQTVGGYPRIAQVIDCDINLLAQYRPGQRLAFHPVSWQQAEALEAAWQQRLANSVVPA
ncbi:MAG: hypothetical protein EP312_05950 [Gammaproteobacteria bacterium]|nr:MAG: hypothetical protein EP312_05950 [Gammaproteobacteria bacterium]